MEFSGAAVSWVIRYSINGCIGSRDCRSIINLWQGLQWYIVRNMDSDKYFALFACTFSSRVVTLAIMEGFSGASGMTDDIGPALSHVAGVRSSAGILKKKKKLFKHIIYSGTTVDICKLRNTVFPKLRMIFNIGKTEWDACSPWDSSPAYQISAFHKDIFKCAVIACWYTRSSLINLHQHRRVNCVVPESCLEIHCC